MYFSVFFGACIHAYVYRLFLHTEACFIFAQSLFSNPPTVIISTMWNFKFKSFLRDEERLPMARRACDVPGCEHPGDFKAPKSRYDLKDYYWFCIDHVRDYNANWDFFKGMSPGEIEHHMHRSGTWDRPTWRSTEAGLHAETTREKIYEHFSRGESVFGDFSGEARSEDGEKAKIDLGSIPHPTIEALAVMGLRPPVDWDDVKTTYKTLVKKYHPDTNKDDKNAEERLKKINLAYNILKLSYQHFTKLDEK